MNHSSQPPDRQPGRVDSGAQPLGAKSGKADSIGSTPGKVEQSAQPLPETETELAMPEPKAPAPYGHWRAVFWLLLSLLGGLLAYQLWRDISLALQAQPWAGGVLAGLGLALLLALILALARELAAFSRLQTAWATQQACDKALAGNDAEAMRQALKPHLKLLHKREPDLVMEFTAGAAGQTEAGEVQRLFEDIVLAPLDAQAKKEIRRSALTVAAAVAVAPHPALDAIIVIWRGFVMVRKVADIYGLRPTSLAALKLVQHTLVNAFVAAGIDAAGSALMTQIGGGVLEIVGKRFAEGVVSSQRLLRLGVLAIEMCRPVPRLPVN
ncbi:MAG: YcjF family protein [Gammaproteobacteria bacterium]